jgi:hypothetical protein
VAAVEYVMVPVPEELASRVLSYVNWKGHPRVLDDMQQDADDAPHAEADAETPARDGDADAGEPIARALARLDDAGRILAGVMAAAALDHEELTVTEAARRSGLTTREAVGAMMELNNLVPSEGGPPLAVFIKDAEGTSDARFSWDARIVLMPEPVARPLADLTRAHPAE